MRPALEGQQIEIARTHPRFGRDRWQQRLAGHTVNAIETQGKNLFIVFDKELLLHSHLRMTGLWDVRPAGGRWRRAPSRAWLVLRAGEQEVIQYDGPVLELMTAGRRRFDQRLAALGPDILAEQFDSLSFLRRLLGGRGGPLAAARLARRRAGDGPCRGDPAADADVRNRGAAGGALAHLRSDGQTLPALWQDHRLPWSG
jgi:formamidopyrimidine-DNA glycosylase